MKKKIITLALAVVTCLSVITSVTAADTLNRVASTIPGTDIEYNYVENVTVQIPGTDVTFDFEGVAEFVFVEPYSEWVAKKDADGNIICDSDGYAIVEEVTYDMPVYTFTFAEECSTAKVKQNGEWLIYEGNLHVGDGVAFLIDKDDVFKMPLLGEDESENKYIRNKLYFGKETYITSDGSFVWEFDSFENLIAKVEFEFLNPNYGGFDEYFDEDGWYYNHYSTLNNTIDISEMAVIESPSYSIIEGANSVVNSNALTIKADGDFDKFTGVKVDGELVDSSNYTATEGSTIIEFKADYLKTLDAGEHTVSVVFTDGEATTKFEIDEDKNTDITDKNENSDNLVTDVEIPNTDYNTSVAAAFVAMSLSGVALVGLKKKK